MQHIKSTVTSENWHEAMGWLMEHYELEYVWPRSTRYNPSAIGSGMLTVGELGGHFHLHRKFRSNLVFAKMGII